MQAARSALEVKCSGRKPSASRYSVTVGVSKSPDGRTIVQSRPLSITSSSILRFEDLFEDEATPGVVGARHRIGDARADADEAVNPVVVHRLHDVRDPD